MPHVSICIPTCNEGDLLVRTVQSLLDVLDELDEAEIIIADDGGTDDSVAKAAYLWDAAAKAVPLRIARHPAPSGTCCAKALGGDSARGAVMVFLDAHTAPQPGALTRLINVASDYGVATPVVAGLDEETWQPRNRGGNGMYVHPEHWQCHWLGLDQLPLGPVEPLRITWAIPGQSFAIARVVYDAVGGWDRGCLAWGSDASLGLRLWCLGFDMLHCPDATIAHLFRRRFPTNRPKPTWWQIFVNRLRVLHSLGTLEEIEAGSASMRTREGAYRRALEYTEQTMHTIPRLQLRCRRTLTDYWATVEMPK